MAKNLSCSPLKTTKKPPKFPQLPVLFPEAPKSHLPSASRRSQVDKAAVSKGDKHAVPGFAFLVIFYFGPFLGAFWGVIFFFLGFLSKSKCFLGTHRHLWFFWVAHVKTSLLGLQRDFLFSWLLEGRSSQVPGISFPASLAASKEKWPAEVRGEEMVKRLQQRCF